MIINQSEKFVPDKNLEHSATFPEKLIKPFILGTSKEGDTILDPCMGSGTTGVACIHTNRKFIGNEKDCDYYQVASNRLNLPIYNAML